MRVLMITCEWPEPGKVHTPHFIKRQAEFLRAAGVDVDVFAFDGARRAGNYVRAWRQARPLLAGGGYDLVHAQFGQSALPALGSALPMVVTLRGSDALGIVGPDGRRVLKGRLLQAATRLAARRADAVIAVSEEIRAWLARRAPVHVIPSGIDFELFRPIPRDEARRRLGLPADERLIAFVGKPGQARKRFALAERAVALLAPELRARLLVAWGVSHQEIPYYLGAADAMVFTSMQEGSPNAVKEALACDLPVVSVAVGDTPERLRGVEGCELCNDERPEALAAALERVLRRGGRVRGREAVRHLDERLLTERVVGIYESVLRARAARRAGVALGGTDLVSPLDTPPRALGIQTSASALSAPWNAPGAGHEDGIPAGPARVAPRT
jgi:teichuronic acid biosynthesis glycosyltransferase TuaC